MYFLSISNLSSLPSVPEPDMIRTVWDRVLHHTGKTDYSTVAAVIARAAAPLNATFLLAVALESEDLGQTAGLGDTEAAS